MKELTTEQKIRRRVREINEHVLAGKPCYWDRKPEERFRVFRARIKKGKFQINPVSSFNWCEADLTDNFEFSR